MYEINISTTEKEQILDITPEVENIVNKSKANEGICVVYAAHATAAIIINENDDPAICQDILDSLSHIVPNSVDFKHNRVDNNAAAHIKSAILGPSETLTIQEDKLLLGRWQAIMLCEFDGPRQRKLYVEIIGK